MKRINNLLLLITIVCTSAFCRSQDPSVSLEFDNAATATQIVKKYVKALENADVKCLADLMADNAMVFGLGSRMDSLNTKQHNAYWANSFTIYEHRISQDLYLPLKAENNWHNGEWLQTYGTNTLTEIKTGKVIPVPYQIAIKIAEGKITRIRYFLDNASILMEQGHAISHIVE